MCSLSFHWSASSSYLLLIYGRFCRFNDTTPHRMGIAGNVHRRSAGGKCGSFQLRSSASGVGAARFATRRLSGIRHLRQYGRRNDLLLHGTTGQDPYQLTSRTCFNLIIKYPPHFHHYLSLVYPLLDCCS